MGFRPEVSYQLKRRVESVAVDVCGEDMETAGFATQVEAVLDELEPLE